jgi:hypothetical protein
MKRDAKNARSTSTRRPNPKNGTGAEAPRQNDTGAFPDPYLDAQSEKMTGPPRRKV